MEKFTVHTGTGLPLRRSNVDTDQIIPAVYLKRVTRTGFADGLFNAWRADPAFVLNDPAYSGATILIAGPEFGTGSSREHAVWALRDYGFRGGRRAAVRRHLPGQRAQGRAAAGAAAAVEAVEELWELVEREPGTEITVDLVERQVRAGDAGPGTFPIDDFSRWRLLEGLDDIGLTLRHDADIAAYEARRPSFTPRLDAPV